MKIAQWPHAVLRRLPAGTSSRPSTATGCRRRSSSRAVRRCAPASTRCRTSSTSRCSRSTAPELRERFLAGRRRRRSTALARRAWPTTSWPRSCRTSAATTSPSCSTALPSLRRGHRPAERRVRLHGQGLGAADRRRPAQPLRAADAARRSTRCARQVGLTAATEWDRFDPDTPAGQSAVRRRGSTSRRVPRRRRCRSQVPAVRPARVDQAGLHPGGVRAAAGRPGPATSRRRARTSSPPSPDVATSTNLGGWINRTGVFAPTSSAGRGTRTAGCCAGPRARPGSTSSSASAR